MNSSDSIATPLVSVIIPVYNAGKYILDALDSVFGQTYPKTEIIVVNDGSTDNSVALLESVKEKIKIIHIPNSGPAMARNRGVSEATGEFLAFLDADDYWDKNKLKVQLEFFAKEPATDICFVAYQEFFSDDLSDMQRKRRTLNMNPVHGNFAGCALIKKSSFDRVGEFDTQYRFGEFIDWLARATEQKLSIRHINDCLYSRRSHSDNFTLREKQSQTDYLRVVKAALERQRKA